MLSIIEVWGHCISHQASWGHVGVRFRVNTVNSLPGNTRLKLWGVVRNSDHQLEVQHEKHHRVRGNTLLHGQIHATSLLNSNDNFWSLWQRLPLHLQCGTNQEASWAQWKVWYPSCCQEYDASYHLARLQPSCRTESTASPLASSLGWQDLEGWWRIMISSMLGR